MNKLSGFLVAATAVSAFLLAFSQRGVEQTFFGKTFTQPLLRPGETIDSMVVTTGVKDAAPFWFFCSSTRENDYSIRVDCGELSHASLAIGHTFGIMDVVLQYIDWEAFTWEMSLDGHPIDLQAFGVYDIVRPDLAPSPSPVREVFKRVRLWDVVLVDPTSGMHRLEGQARSPDGAAIYTWVVDFTVTTPLRPAPRKALTS